MPATAESPLSLLVGNALEALGACDTAHTAHGMASSPSETVEQIAVALLVSMGLGEVASDLDLKAVALLGAASLAGLQRIEQEEPGLHDAAAAMLALEDLLRRTAEGSR